MPTQTLDAVFGATTQLQQALGKDNILINDFAKNRIKVKQNTLKTLSNLEKAHAKNMARNLGDSNKQIMNLTRKASKTLSDGLGKSFYDIISGSKSAKDAFKDFSRSFIQDLIQMSSRMIASQAVKGALGAFGFSTTGAAYAKGGVMPGHFVPATPMATGGIFSRPTLGLVAEGKNAEAVVPLPDNRSIPVKMSGQPEQRPITVINVLDQSMIEGVVSDTLAKKSQVIVNMIGNDIRQGGVTYQAVKGTR